MNIVVLHGSPRKNGDSDTLVATFINAYCEVQSAEVIHFRLNDMQIKPCQGCLRCMQRGICCIQDDMQEIYSAFSTADIVVWASPMYWGYLTAQMKLALDRMESLVCRDGWKGKTFVVLLTYHHHVQSTVNFFERVCPYFETDLHIVPCQTYDHSADRHIPASEKVAELARCKELARLLARN